MSDASGKVRSSRVRFGSPCTSTWSTCLLTMSAASRARSMRPLSTRMSRTETATTGLGNGAAARSSSGSSSKRNCRRPNGYISSSTMSGLATSNASSSACLRLTFQRSSTLLAVLVEQVGELRIRRDRRRQLHHARARRRDPRDRRAAQHEVDLGAGLHQRPRNRRRPLEMPDAQQVLHVEEDAGRSHIRRSLFHSLFIPSWQGLALA